MVGMRASDSVFFRRWVCAAIGLSVVVVSPWVFAVTYTVNNLSDLGFNLFPSCTWEYACLQSCAFIHHVILYALCHFCFFVLYALFSMPLVPKLYTGIRLSAKLYFLSSSSFICPLLFSSIAIYAVFEAKHLSISNAASSPKSIISFLSCISWTPLREPPRPWRRCLESLSVVPHYALQNSFPCIIGDIV